MKCIVCGKKKREGQNIHIKPGWNPFSGYAPEFEPCRYEEKIKQGA